MNTLRILYHLMRADFLERVRRYSFLITLGMTIFAGYVFVPSVDADYVTLDLGGYRGVYDSAWIGSMVALLTTIFLSLAGFYLVKNAVDRDRHSGVGQIIATTPLSKPLYTLGKWLSNFAVLAVMVGVIAAAAGAMQLIRGEEVRIGLWALLSPFFCCATCDGLGGSTGCIVRNHFVAARRLWQRCLFSPVAWTPSIRCRGGQFA